MDKDSNDWDVVGRMFTENGYGTRLHSKWFSEEWFRMFWVPEGETMFFNSTLNNQLTHTTLKQVELLKHFKISKTAPTCFGLQGNHLQGATVST